MTEEPERAAAGRASARGEKDKRERDLNFSDGTLDSSPARPLLVGCQRPLSGFRFCLMSATRGPTPRAVVLLSTLTLLAVACGDDPAPEPEVPEACLGSDQPNLELGHGVGGAFAPLADAEEVGLIAAPQGGFGVTVLVRTRGLAVVDNPLRFSLEPWVDDEVAGHFEFDRRIQCLSNGTGGLLNGTVVGFDETKYGTNDALLSLDGQLIELVITAEDVDGRTATVRRPVTLLVGG